MLVGFDNVERWYDSSSKMIHRKDGPAVIYPNGNQFWFLNNEIYYFDNFCKKLNLSEEDIIILKLKYGA